MFAYLDDTYVLSNSGDTLNNINNCFSQRDTTLHLSMTKSFITDL